MFHGKIGRVSQDIAYDLVIDLEDDQKTSSFLKELRFKQLFGAYLNGNGELVYTSDYANWFDLGLISAYGQKRLIDLSSSIGRRTGS